MIFKHRYLNIYLYLLSIILISSSIAEFCRDLPSDVQKDTPCFLEPPTRNPGLLRSSGNSLVLPCHVAHSKHSTVEWWYQDFQKTIDIKIYPVYPAVRPTVLRFITSVTPTSQISNATDIIDASVLLRHVNIDDSGIYRCVIRPWKSHVQDNILEEIKGLPSINYHVQLTGPRLCQASLGALPCFTSMRTTSPTILDAYQTAFLQCVVHTYNRPVNVMWVVGNASVNSVLITDHLSTNQHNGDRLRRVFPLSPSDHSIELTINRDIPERSYSCVIDGTSEVETTLFTYIVRPIDLQNISEKTIKKPKDETVKETELEKEKEQEHVDSTVKPDKIIAHDALTSDQIDELREKNIHEHKKKKTEKVTSKEEVDVDLLDLLTREETTTKR
jgi:hypothetical protein